MSIAVIIANIVNIIANLIIIIVIVDTLVSYFLSPFHPVRETLDRLIAPLLNPIRRVVPLVGMLDLSPLILIILVEVVSYALKSLLYAL